MTEASFAHTRACLTEYLDSFDPKCPTCSVLPPMQGMEEAAQAAAKQIAEDLERDLFPPFIGPMPAPRPPTRWERLKRWWHGLCDSGEQSPEPFEGDEE